MGFSYHISEEGQCDIYQLEGRFLEQTKDHAILDSMVDHMGNEPRDVMVDLAGLEYMNSMGIQVMIKFVHLVGQHQRKIVFVSVPPRVNDLLQVIKLNAIFEIKRDRKEGIKFLNNN